MKAKFVTSKLKLFLIIMILTMLTFLEILGTILVLVEVNDGTHVERVYVFIFIAAIVLIFISIILILATKFVYFVKVFEDRFVFTNIFRKKHTLLFSDIINIYTMEFYKEGKLFMIEARGHPNMIKFGYPFKFDYNKKTKKIVEDVWKNPVLDMTVQVKK
jgi:hypothetical protein